LLADLETMSFCAVGRKYGVTDNAVRKWLRWYERQRERGAGGEQAGGDQLAA
jgi:transposase-like protein